MKRTRAGAWKASACAARYAAELGLGRVVGGVEPSRRKPHDLGEVTVNDEVAALETESPRLRFLRLALVALLAHESAEADEPLAHRRIPPVDPQGERLAVEQLVVAHRGTVGRRRAPVLRDRPHREEQGAREEEVERGRPDQGPQRHPSGLRRFPRSTQRRVCDVR